MHSRVKFSIKKKNNNKKKIIADGHTLDTAPMMIFCRQPFPPFSVTLYSNKTLSLPSIPSLTFLRGHKAAGAEVQFDLQVGPVGQWALFPR